MTKEVRLAASYSELNESLQQRVELVMRFFLALDEPVDGAADNVSQGDSLSSIPVASSIEIETQASLERDAASAKD